MGSGDQRSEEASRVVGDRRRATVEDLHTAVQLEQEWRRRSKASYALNFDDGQVQNGDLDKTFRSFSLRYAFISISVKLSMANDALSFA
ncbi:hypothetical protein ACSBR1_034225 [Camellia fascicularis]